MIKQISILNLLASFVVATTVGSTLAIAAAPAACISCHGVEGTSNDKDLPIIGGMSSEYLKSTLKAYKSGDRKACPKYTIKSGAKKGTKTDMCQAVKSVNDADIAAAAESYSSKPFVRAKQITDATIAKKGKEVFEQNCEKCHSNGGSLKEDDSSILSGQWMQYVKSQVEDYRSGKRIGSEKMTQKLKKLNQSDIDALVQYLGSN